MINGQGTSTILETISNPLDGELPPLTKEDFFSNLNLCHKTNVEKKEIKQNCEKNKQKIYQLRSDKITDKFSNFFEQEKVLMSFATTSKKTINKTKK